MDYRSLTYDVCRRYVADQKGQIDDSVLDQVLGWIRSRDISRLSSVGDFIPHAYSHEGLCRFSRQVAAFFKKNKAFSERELCETAARSAFVKAERICRITNKRLDHYYLHDSRIDPEIKKVLVRSQSIIADTLGDFGEFLEGLPSEIRVTSGASATRSRKNSYPYQKVRFKGLSASRKATPYLRALATFWGYEKFSVSETLTNRVETVPKNWKTDRTIACEPEGNLFLQIAFDGFVKRKLQKIGVDLSDQSLNQRLAKTGSIDGSYTTIDLSMASDTVSLNAVGWLFPLKWYQYLCDIRSPFGIGFGKRFKYAKLSSMGNGATFSVETLIFASLCRAVGASSFAVYGDDIVIPPGCVELLLRTLKFLGFQVNQEKSYFDGPFRESCGTDWYSGRNITPFYLRCESNSKTELCHIVNGLAVISCDGGQLEELLVNLVDEHALPLVPHNSSSISGVWITPHDAYALKLIQTTHQIQKFKAFVPKTRRRTVVDSRTLFLWHLDAGRRRNGELPRRSFHPFLSGYGIPAETDDMMKCIIRSTVPTFSHKYVRKWVCWFSPAEVTPAHLYRWTERLVRRKAD